MLEETSCERIIEKYYRILGILGKAYRLAQNAKIRYSSNVVVTTQVPLYFLSGFGSSQVMVWEVDVAAASYHIHLPQKTQASQRR